MRTLSTLITAATAIQYACAAAQPRAHIKAGTLLGGHCSNNADAVFFKAVPCGEPPVGKLRLEAPEPYIKSYSHGVLNATTPAPSCIQFDGSSVDPILESEDCLYLDIWAPANATNTSSLPVRVWIYGGSDATGSISDPVYDGCNVPSTGAIMVSLNYRLGPLGFLAVPDAGIAGNQGIQDILLGLQWVKDNIAAFGGDLGKVLLHGQSAGAVNVFTIASLPRAKTLIRAAIMQSGGGREAPLAKVAHDLGSNFAQAMGCNNKSCLQSAMIESYINVSATLPLLNSNPLPAVSLSSPNGFFYAPFVDGKIVPHQPSEGGVQVPAIFGSNSLEGSLFALQQFFNGTALNVDASDYDLFLLSNFGETFVSTIKQYYPLSDFSQYPYPALVAISYVESEATYRCPAYRGLRIAAQNGVPVWNYYFDHAPKCSWEPGIPQAAVPLLRAAHTAEIPFVFGDTTHLPLPNGTCNMTADEVAISHFLNGAWTHVARSATPGDNKTWPQYTTKQPNGLLIQNKTSTYAVNETKCKLWDKIAAFQYALAKNGTLGGQNATGVDQSV